MQNHPPASRFEPPPHPLADWVHQKFLERTDIATSTGGAGTSWREMLIQPVAFNTVRPVATIQHLVFTRAEVLRGHTGAAVDRLMALTDTAASCMSHRASLRLAFSGFKNDRREIGQIQEIGSFIRSITRQWPYWLHFLAPEVDNLGVLLTLISSSEVTLKGDHLQRGSLTPQDVESLQHLVHCTLRLHDCMGLPAYVTHDMGRDLRDSLCQTFV